MRVKKMMAGCLTAVMCVGMLSGCGSDDSTAQFKTYSKCATINSADYTNIEYVPASREVTDDDVQSAIDDFCEENSETSEDKESAIADGDEVNVDYVETISGTEKDSQESYTLNIGEDTLGEGSDDQLIGCVPGDTRTISVTYADDYEDTTLAGLTAKYEVTINYISVTTVPDYTDDLVKKATDGEYTTTDAYTEHLTEDLQSDADDEADDSDRSALIKAVVDKVTFDSYPESEIAAYIQDMVTSAQTSANNYGIDFETYMTYFYGYSDEASFLDYLHGVVEDVMKEKIVVSCIALDNDLIADDDDIAAYRQKLVEDNDLEDESVIDTYYTSDDLMFYATEENVLDFLMERGVQVESTEETTEETEAEAEEDGVSGDDTEADVDTEAE